MKALIDFIHKKQEKGTVVVVKFKNSPSVYIKPESSLTPISDDFVHLKSDVSIKGSVDSIYNINDISRVDVVTKKED